MPNVDGPMLAHLRELGPIVEEVGSPFTGQLISRFAEDFAAGGPVADLLRDWPGPPRGDAVAVRLASALHHAALCAPDGPLAAVYPARCPDWDMDAVWARARAYLAAERDAVAAFIRSPPQTNEVRRAIVLLRGFLEVMATHAGPFEMLELGASAGLNLHWDAYAYRTATWSYGSGDVTIDTAWEGPPPPLDVTPRIHGRAGCDLNPLDLRDPARRRKLRAYVWADQVDRLARFDGAADVAAKSPTQVQRADAGVWLRERLASRTEGVGTIVYHSVFLQYPPPKTRAAIEATLAEAGANATAASPLAWVRYEPESIQGVARGSARFVLDVTVWPGGQRQVLGYTDGHARHFRAPA